MGQKSNKYLAMGAMRFCELTPNRMIMGLCLLVYTQGKRQIRAALRESKLTIKNQLGKATDCPTLRWIFQRFQCIHLVEFNNEKHVSNWTPDRDFILNLLPDDCLRYYQLVT
ncbi:MAG: hypothetical protein HEQ35_30910 [Gloeotrichia echinulata IR180]